MNAIILIVVLTVLLAMSSVVSFKLTTSKYLKSSRRNTIVSLPSPIFNQLSLPSSSLSKLLSTSTTVSVGTDPSPGNPVVRSTNKETGKVVMAVSLTGEQTQRAFAEACDTMNEEVKTRGYKVAGFRPGSKLPPVYLYEIFGEDRLVSFLHHHHYCKLLLMML